MIRFQDVDGLIEADLEDQGSHSASEGHSEDSADEPSGSAVAEPKETAVAVFGGGSSALVVTEQQSEYVTQSDESLAHLNHVAEELRSHGVMRCAAHVHEEIRKEEWRRRSASALDDDLAKAPVRRTDADASIARSQLMLAAELNELADKARETKQ